MRFGAGARPELRIITPTVLRALRLQIGEFASDATTAAAVPDIK